jgi:hypothetical protein
MGVIFTASLLTVCGFIKLQTFYVSFVSVFFPLLLIFSVDCDLKQFFLASPLNAQKVVVSIVIEKFLQFQQKFSLPFSLQRYGFQLNFIAFKLAHTYECIFCIKAKLQNQALFKLNDPNNCGFICLRYC